MSRTIAVIPARYGSTRFPGKPLALIAGKPMVQWCYESTSKCKELDDVLVATDDQRIVDAVTSFGGKAVMTSPNHATGTDRIAEAIQGDSADLILNVQGDEPLMSANVLSRLILTMRESGAEMGTAAVPFKETGRDPMDPNAVKVVVDKRGFALYFSRSLIPFPRKGGVPVEPLLHWGLYAYRRDFLNSFVKWERGTLEACESLEQLRALENGAKISVIVTNERSVGVDVPEDIELVEKLIREKR
ncbi:MAG: 3-deoxy-manno-octulosonate cytidylyltransferase [Victivallales bacterium]|jgi:3-deoxy-manno-octulosonate cytidylyltransferase (CMP-KDO synthetase)|nr:3-deoxy-manno-octulosonate cytidylyltransferase [Victivallales bacterium]